MNDNHWREFHDSGISDGLIERAGIRTVENAEIAHMLGWQPVAYHWGTGWAIPYASGYWRVKLDHPRIEGDEAIKYESPRGQPNRAYFSPGFDDIFGTSGVLLVTEGEKKALAATDRGFACIGLVGVWGWMDKRARRRSGRATGLRRLIPDLNRDNLWLGRRVFIVFDSDAAQKEQVRRAQAELAHVLIGRGADVRIVRLPTRDDGSKVGLDDFLVSHGDRGAEALNALMDQAQPPGRTPRASVKPNLMDLADRFIERKVMHRDGVILRSWRNQFWSWTGTHYHKLVREDLEKEVLNWLDTEVDNATPRMARSILDCIAAKTMIPSHLDQPLWIHGQRGENPADFISMGNGILDLKALLDGKDEVQRLHSPRFFCLAAVPYEFKRDATCSRWSAFLEEIFENDPDRISLLQEWFGYNLVPSTEYQKFMQFVGEGANGKSVVMAVLEALLGEDNVSHVALESFGGRFALASTIGKLANIVPEVGDLAKPEEAAFKAFVGGDRMQMEQKNLPPTEEKPTTRVTIATNVLPRWADRSDGIWRRMLLIPFRVTVPEERQDRQLARKIIDAELPGIFLWAVAGLVRLRQRGQFTTPSVSREAVTEYRTEVNPARQFLSDECEADPECEVPYMGIYAAFKDWCEQRGYHHLSEANFAKEIRRALPAVERVQKRLSGKRVWVYRGLRLCRGMEACPDTVPFNLVRMSPVSLLSPVTSFPQKNRG